MGAEGTILFWWVMFGGTHIAGSSQPVRNRLVQALGLPGFKGLYSVVSFATFLPLCFVYSRHKHAGAQLFAESAALEGVAHLLMLLAFITIGQGLVTPSPITTAAEMSGKYSDTARGIQRITRHPNNTAFALFGIAHCLANPDMGDWVFFGGFVIYAILSALHQDARTRALGPEEVQRFQADTSLVPFGAILAGRQHLAFGEFSRPALGFAVGFVVLIRLFHGAILGGFGT